MAWVRVGSLCHSALRAFSSGSVCLVKASRIRCPAGPITVESPRGADLNSVPSPIRLNVSARYGDVSPIGSQDPSAICAADLEAIEPNDSGSSPVSRDAARNVASVAAEGFFRSLTNLVGGRSLSLPLRRHTTSISEMAVFSEK